MIDIPCVIFAGGKSSRMGKDKALLPFGGFPTLLDYQIHKLQKIFSHLYISCKNKASYNCELECIEDKDTKEFAPTAGFIASFEYLKCEKFFVISVDTPFIDEVHFLSLLQEDEANPYIDATVARTNTSLHPMCAIYHRSLYPEFLQMQEMQKHKLTRLLENAKVTYVVFADSKSFVNLNTPEEYNDALTLL